MCKKSPDLVAIKDCNYNDMISVSGPSQNHGGHPDRNRLQGDGHARRSEGTPAKEPGTPQRRPEVRAGRATPRGQQIHREHLLGSTQDAAVPSAGVLRRSDEGILCSGCVGECRGLVTASAKSYVQL